ncbi:hypothetical protein WICPIJ_009144 [Wickerhamomyces pijperi]|uniref:AP-1 complex subunit gamma n=1 Tax=Wickerhamomyces pijperi TaxID=599730 RepID=A0A9P8PS78_WICPI|nr:hypothetical protein WICPIJ_009144 [Wickerhamomyces pijperi]
MSSLKSFIKAVRSSKTLADAKHIATQESANIRTSFKDVTITHSQRRVLISKLIYLYILGEKTHFGQIECINLLSSPKFADKRLGYLATMLLIDENQEVLTLLTNSIQMDLHHPNNFIQGLALSTLGNVMSVELANDLYNDVEGILRGNNSYLVKKAAIVTAKILEKNPDLGDVFIGHLDHLLNNTNHGVLLGALQMVRVLRYNGEHNQELVKYLPKIIEILKNLVFYTNVPEYDAVGINDPFLQNSAIKTLSLFFTDDSLDISQTVRDSMNDVLTAIISYTSYSKSVGASILYETVKFIFSIPNLDQSLKILGINTLGQLLSVKDNNNNRYIALNLLLKVVELEPLAVQRHQQLIILCLGDMDLSIKRRALELAFAILDTTNIRILVKEILRFLENSNEKDLQAYIIQNVTSILSKDELLPNQNWKYETLIKLVNIGGSAISNPAKILSLILNNPDRESTRYVLLKLFQSGYKDFSRSGLNMVNVYLLGEFGELLFNQKMDEHGVTITEDSIVSYLKDLLLLQENGLNSYLLTACLKLSTKSSSSKTQAALRSIIENLRSSIDLNVQVNSSVYLSLLNESSSVKSKILAKIPPPVVSTSDSITLIRPNANGNNAHSHRKISKTEDLLDLINDDSQAPVKQNNRDLLEDLFSSTPAVPVVSSAFSGSSSTANSNNNSSSAAVKAFSNDQVSVSFSVKSQKSGEVVIETQLQNNTSTEISQVQLLIAVPKTQKLTINTLNSTSIAANGGVNKQDLRIVGAHGSGIKLRVKFKYFVQGAGEQVETFDYKFEGVCL